MVAKMNKIALPVRLGYDEWNTKCFIDSNGNEVSLTRIAEAINQPVKTCNWAGSNIPPDYYRTECKSSFLERYDYKYCPCCGGVIEL